MVHPRTLLLGLGLLGLAAAACGGSTADDAATATAASTATTTSAASGSGGAGGSAGGDGAGGAIASAPCTGPTVQTKAIRYASTDEKNTFDLYRPTTGGPCPLVIWVHGGAWAADATLTGAPAHAVFPLLDRGYAVAALRFRLSGDAPWPAEIFDVKAAVRYLRANAEELGVDADRFAIWGVSSGGNLSALLAFSRDVPALEDLSMGSPDASSEVRALVDCYGPTYLPLMDPELASNGCAAHFQYHHEGTSPESRFLGCPNGLADCPQAVDADPVTYVDAGDPPAMLSHGLADCTVPWEQSQRLEDALTAAGVTTSLTLVPDSGHEIGSCPPTSVVAAFLDEQLR